MKEKEFLSLLLLQSEIMMNLTADQRLLFHHLYPIALDLADSYVNKVLGERKTQQS
jgi:hypothetical protein